MQKSIYLSGLLVALMMSCGSDGANPSGNATGQSEPPMEGVSVSFYCRMLSTSDAETPEAEVVFKLGKQEVVLDTILACEPIEPKDYAQFGMPREAVAACGGWWAGRGEYFYAYLEGEHVVVRYGWQEEEQTDQGFHYQGIHRMSMLEAAK